MFKTSDKKYAIARAEFPIGDIDSVVRTLNYDGALTIEPERLTIRETRIVEYRRYVPEGKRLTE